MSKMSSYPYMVALIAQSFPQSFFRVKRNAVLVKISFFQIFTDTYKTGIRL